jgi:NAD(P)-dependent dehydrogenase (short-subunit alcohol dehydrogenase family)
LCLNAGVAPYAKATTPRLTKQGFEECIGVNHLGHFLLANLLQDKLQQGGGRLVVTASSVHDPEGPGGRARNVPPATLGDLSGLGINLQEHPDGPTMVDGSIIYNGMKCYKDSKLCNIVFVQEAVRRFPNLQVRTFTPGFIPTTGLFQPWRDQAWWSAQAVSWFAWLSGITVDVQVGGDRLVYMALSSDEEIPNGSYFCGKGSGTTKETGFVATPVSKEGSDEDLARRLWEKSSLIVKEWLA